MRRRPAPGGRPDPRRAVLALLLERGDFPTRRFPAAADAAGLEGRDRAFARQLLAGAIRHRRTLDAVFRPFCARRRVDEAVLWTLRLALYQRFWLAQVPPYAAIAGTLDSGRPFLKKAVGFCNAVLRAVERAVEEAAADSPPAADLLVAGGRAWRFDRPLFPDPAQDPVGYAAVTLSYPDELATRWAEAAGLETARARMACFDRTPPLGLRVNPLRARPEEVLAELAAAGLACRPGPVEGTILLEQPAGDLRHLPGFAAGLWAVQDLSALEAVRLAAPRPGERVLDWCAAPGGKALACVELAGGDLELHACDVDHARLARLGPEAARLGHSGRVHEHVIGPDGAGAPEGPWDLILLDVPCTNTGVLGKRPEARWRFSSEALERTVALQRRIAAAAAAQVGPATRLLWSTCSLEPEENRAGAEHLAERTGRRIAAERLVEPAADRSGGYAALLVP